MSLTFKQVAKGLALTSSFLALATISSDSVQSRETAQDAAATSGRYCSSTAASLFRACGFAAQDDYWTSVAKCTNESDSRDRAECMDDAKTARDEANQLCQAQYAGRLDACNLLGEGRYDPPFEAADFETNFADLKNANRYFPLAIGNRWEYRSGDQTITDEVLNRTKLIDDVRCVVIRDTVTVGGRVAEATDDWFAQAKDGNVWYCGEEVKEYETFAGDRPRAPELVNIDGSFKAGREGDKAGIIFLANPAKGRVYLEEFSLGNAEDITEIVSTTYRFGAEPALDRGVPRALAALLCHGDCVVTKNQSLLEPGIVERKYYAPGIGVFLEVTPSSGEVIRLTNCNFDSRCNGLPR